MSKRLTEQEFQDAIATLDVGPQTQDIAHGVLVEGRQQSEYVTKYGLTRSAVSQAVNRVFSAAQFPVPEGYQRITVVVTDLQAYQAYQWDRAAKERLRKK